MTSFNKSAIAFFLIALVGCSGDPKFYPVSGTISLDGKPYPNGVVTFQPIGSKDNPTPGRGSSAYTDANGRFVLKVEDAIPGAVPGMHLVRIMTKGNNVMTMDPLKGSSDAVPANRKIDPIPPEWNSLSKVEFEVPVGGSDKANFNIETKKQ